MGSSDGEAWQGPTDLASSVHATRDPLAGSGRSGCARGARTWRASNVVSSVQVTDPHPPSDCRTSRRPSQERAIPMTGQSALRRPPAARAEPDRHRIQPTARSIAVFLDVAEAARGVDAPELFGLADALHDLARELVPGARAHTESPGDGLSPSPAWSSSCSRTSPCRSGAWSGATGSWPRSGVAEPGPRETGRSTSTSADCAASLTRTVWC